MQTVIVVIVVLCASSTAARRSAATQAVVEQCVSLSEAPAQENNVHIYDELYHVTKNPFLWKDYEPIPFDEMHPSLLLSAACELVQDLHAGLDELEYEATATWTKIVRPLEMLYDSYDRVTSVFELLAAVNQTSEMEAAVDQGMTLARGFNRRLHQSRALYGMLRQIRKHWSAGADSSVSQRQVLDHVMASMREQGVAFARDPITSRYLNHLEDEETELKRKFVNNVAQGTADFHLTLRDGEHLRGVPQLSLAAMAEAAQKRNLTFWRPSFIIAPSGAIHPPISAPPLEGAAPTPEWGPWTVTFDPFVYESMMAYCPTRRIRQLLYQSYENRASRAPWDNVPVVERILKVRHGRARLLRLSSYADLVGRRRMASPRKANEFLDTVLTPVASIALRTSLQVVRLMADSEARGEDIWGTRQTYSDLRSLGATGNRVAMDRNGMVAFHTKKHRAGHPHDYISPWGALPETIPSKIDVNALERAEIWSMTNETLPHFECVELLALVTSRLRHWDIPYWARRVDDGREPAKQNAADFSNYFTLSRVLSGAFGLLNRLWGIHVVESVRDKPPVWHPEVKYFQLFNGTNLLGSFFFDPFARTNKLSSPFTRILVKRSEAHAYLPGEDRTPVVVMSTNIKAPGPGEPALLQINDVLAVFHELGHVFQNLANQNSEVLIAGTTILPVDFSQMFSQFHELWATEKCDCLLCSRTTVLTHLDQLPWSTIFRSRECSQTLTTIAQHYKTHALLTADERKELIQPMRRMRPFVLLEKIYMSRIDLLLHSGYTANATHTALTHRHHIASDTFLLPYSANNCDFCTLVDSFGSRHGAGYYSNLYSSAYASDAMGYFEEVGIRNGTLVRALGKKMAAELLVEGVKDDTKSQYTKFRGRLASTRYLIAHL